MHFPIGLAFKKWTPGVKILRIVEGLTSPVPRIQFSTIEASSVRYKFLLETSCTKYAILFKETFNSQIEIVPTLYEYNLVIYTQSSYD